MCDMNCFYCKYQDCNNDALTAEDVKAQNKLDACIVNERRTKKQMTKIKANNKYEKTEKAKERQKKYEKTEKAKERQKRYEKTEKARERQRRYEEKRKQKRLAERGVKK